MVVFNRNFISYKFFKIQRSSFSWAGSVITFLNVRILYHNLTLLMQMHLSDFCCKIWFEFTGARSGVMGCSLKTLTQVHSATCLGTCKLSLSFWGNGIKCFWSSQDLYIFNFSIDFFQLSWESVSTLSTHQSSCLNSGLHQTRPKQWNLTFFRNGKSAGRVPVWEWSH